METNNLSGPIQVHFLFPHAHSPMGRLFDTTEVKSDAGPTVERTARPGGVTSPSY